MLNQVKLPANEESNCRAYEPAVWNKQICAGKINGKLKLSCRVTIKNKFLFEFCLLEQKIP